MTRTRLLLLAVSVLLSATACRAAERMGTLQLAGTTNLVRQLWKIGGFTGNEGLSTVAPEIVRMLPSVRFFGRGRSGVSTVFVIMSDDEGSHTAVLYPVTVTPEEFVKSHDGAKRLEDGTVEVPYEADCSTCSATVWPYVVFSKDLRWAGGGNTADEARLALKEIALAERPMSNDLLRVCLNAEAFPKLFDGRAKESLGRLGPGIGLTGASPMLSSEMSVAVRINDRSLDLVSRMRMKKDSGVDKWGKTALPADAFAPADTNAVMAYAVTPGFPKNDLNINSMVDFLRTSEGRKLGCAAREVAGNFTTFRIGADITSDEVSWKPPAGGSYGVSFVLDRASGWRTDLSARFDRIMPELKSRPLQFKFIALSHLISPGADRFMRPRRAVDRPTEGLTYAGWCEGEFLHSVLRITAEEVRVMLDSLGDPSGSPERHPEGKASARH